MHITNMSNEVKNFNKLISTFFLIRVWIKNHLKSSCRCFDSATRPHKEHNGHKTHIRLNESITAKPLNTYQILFHIYPFMSNWVEVFSDTCCYSLKIVSLKITEPSKTIFSLFKAFYRTSC